MSDNQEFERNGNGNGNGKSLLAGMVVGSLIGAGTMLLFAPQPGAKTRADLKQGAVDLRNRTSETVKDTVTQVKSKAGKIKADVQIKAGELGRQGKDLLSKQLDRVSHAAEAGKKAIESS